MGEYEREQRSLLALWEEEEDDTAIDQDDSEADDEIDNISVCSDYPDFEQDGEYVEEAEEEDPEVRQQQEGDKESRFFLGKNGTKWFKQFPNKNVRTRSENIITHLPGVKIYGKTAKTPLECFLLFIDEQMIADITENTNRKFLNAF